MARHKGYGMTLEEAILQAMRVMRLMLASPDGPTGETTRAMKRFEQHLAMLDNARGAKPKFTL